VYTGHQPPTTSPRSGTLPASTAAASNRPRRSALPSVAAAASRRPIARRALQAAAASNRGVLPAGGGSRIQPPLRGVRRRSCRSIHPGERRRKAVIGEEERRRRRVGDWGRRKEAARGLGDGSCSMPRFSPRWADITYAEEQPSTLNHTTPHTGGPACHRRFSAEPT
jgi:hypothetical protein